MNITTAIFVINLEYRTDRRAEMQKQLSAIDWEVKYFPAIRPDSAADFPTIGARGCFLSHLAVLKRGRDAGVQTLVILEDDVNFITEFQEHWALAMSELEKREWSIFCAGHNLDALPAGLSRIPPDKPVLFTHFMMINSPAIDALIDGLELILSRPAGHPLGGSMHVDGAYSTIRKQDRSLITYAYFPRLGYQRPSRTDVGNRKWFDHMKVLNPVVSFARKFKS